MTSPRTGTSGSSSHTCALRSAKHLVYRENQFLWSPEIVNVLADKLRRPPADGFRVVIMLPGRPNTGEDDTRGQLALLAEADSGEGRFLATTIRSRSGQTSDRVYVHAKVGIIDDRWLTLGSANLNAHSFYNDSEVNLVTCDTETRTRHATATVGRPTRSQHFAAGRSGSRPSCLIAPRGSAATRMGGMDARSTSRSRLCPPARNSPGRANPGDRLRPRDRPAGDQPALSSEPARWHRDRRLAPGRGNGQHDGHRRRARVR